MSTLFSRRPGKSKLGFGNSASTKHNRFGTGISSTDFEKLADADDVSLLLREQQQNHSAVLRSGSSPASRGAALETSTHVSARGTNSGEGWRPHQSAKTLPATFSTYDQAVDDFGRVPTTQTRSRITAPRSNATLAANSRSLSVNPTRGPLSPRLPADTNVMPAGANASASASGKEAYPYGYTHEGWDVEMTQTVAKQVVDLCAHEIKERGLDSPLIFSSMAIDLSAFGVASLIRAFIASDQTRLKSSPLADQIRYASPHDLAAMIKWTLARLGRFYAVPVPSFGPTKKGEVQEEMAVVQQRGWLELDWYMTWREHERGSSYPWTAFSQFCHTIDDEAAELLRSLFSLLSSTVSYSLKNGMTPSKLARLFGALLFGLPEDETFSRTYEAYVRASNATEHLLLAYIRDLAAYEVLPVRLMSHVDGYPASLSTDLSKPPKHVRTVPITQVERRVRFYSQDLIQTACEWDVANQSEEWAACCSSEKDQAQRPQLSEVFRQLIHLRGGSATNGSARRSNSRSDQNGARAEKTEQRRNPGQNEESSLYSSIVDEKWGNFLSEGFAAPDQTRLNFDLRESERKARVQKRDTLAWSDFQNLGFDTKEGDASWSNVLSFNDTLQQDMKRWPDERAELLERLRINSSKAPPFPYDGTPRVVAHAAESPSEQALPAENGETIFNRMDDVFAQVWADYLVGNGWSNRDEPTHRAANFVVLQFKSRPSSSTVGAHTTSTTSTLTTASVVSLAVDGVKDDRDDAAWFVVQEIVPSGYRADLEAAGRSSKNRTRGAVRKVRLFSRLRKDRTSGNAGGTQQPEHSPWLSDKENEGFFPPGTKKLLLNPDPAAIQEPSFDLERSGTAKANKKGMASLFSSPLIGSPADSTDEASHQQHQLGRSGIMTSLRGRARRLGASQSEEAPEVPPKSPPTPTQGLSNGHNDQTGGFKTASSSFGSSDFETRSLRDSEDESAAANRPADQKAGKRRSLLRPHGRRQNATGDGGWVDVTTRNSSLGLISDGPSHAIRPERTSSLVQELPTERDAGSMSGRPHLDQIETEDAGDFSPVTTPKQESVAQLAPPPSGSPTSPKVTPVPSSPTSTRKPVSSAADAHSSSPTSHSVSSANQVSPRATSARTPPAAAPGDVSDRAETATPTSRLSPEPSTDSDLRATLTRSISSENHQDLGAFPTPPSRPITGDKPSGPPLDRNSILSTASTEGSEGVETIAFDLPGRANLRPVGEVSKAERDQRVSAALNRARELRAKLQPVEARKASNEEAALPAARSVPRESTRPTAVKPKLDPFAKNPTSGKVASIAARFKEPEQPSKLGPSSPSKLPGLKPVAQPRSPSSAPAAAQKNLSTTNSAVSTNGGSPLTRAALASVGGGSATMLDPETPPSPRVSEGGYAGNDNESLAPDDAASNYSRSTEDSVGGEALGQGGTSSGAGRGWDKSSQAEHARQQALQSSFLTGGQSVPKPSVADGENEIARAEEEDVFTELPTHFAEPYRPGQPLENLAEESESMLSGSNNG